MTTRNKLYDITYVEKRVVQVEAFNPKDAIKKFMSDSNDNNIAKYINSKITRVHKAK